MALATHNKAELSWLESHRCQHNHTYSSHYSCFLKDHPQEYHHLFDRPRSEKHVFLGDMQIPFHDALTVDLTIRFVTDWQPDHIWLLGDIIDFYQISRFNKDPRRLNDLQKDIDAAIGVLERIRGDCPSAAIHFIGGNHEYRMQRFKMENAGTHSLRALEIDNLLELKSLDIDYTPYDDGVDYKGFYICHGILVSKHSGWTAKAHYERFGGCGMCGHSHRGGSHLVTKRGDTEGWWENFCLCDLNPEYVQSPNWQQGFSIGYFMDDRFHITQVPIIGYKFIVEGELYH